MSWPHSATKRSLFSLITYNNQHPGKKLRLRTESGQLPIVFLGHSRDWDWEERNFIYIQSGCRKKNSILQHYTLDKIIKTKLPPRGIVLGSPPLVFLVIYCELERIHHCNQDSSLFWPPSGLVLTDVHSFQKKCWREFMNFASHKKPPNQIPIFQYLPSIFRKSHRRPRVFEDTPQPPASMRPFPSSLALAQWAPPHPADPEGSDARCHEAGRGPSDSSLWCAPKGRKMGCKHLGWRGCSCRCDGILGTGKSWKLCSLTILLGEIPRFHGLLATELLIFFVMVLKNSSKRNTQASWNQKSI